MVWVYRRNGREWIAETVLHSLDAGRVSVTFMFNLIYLFLFVLFIYF
jgi:hypothetical protein